MEINWVRCFICQIDTDEKLRSSDEGYKNLAERLPEFKNAGLADSLDFSQIDDGSGIFNTLQKKMQFTIKIVIPCTIYNIYFDLKKKGVKDNDDDLQKRKRCKIDIGEAVCIFCGENDSRENLCAAGEYHNKSNSSIEHVSSLTGRWREMALHLGELDIHAKLCVGDVRANEIYYHKLHYTQFRNRYRASLARVKAEQSDDSLKRCYAMKQLIRYMYGISDTLIDAAELENTYRNLLANYNLEYSSHISRFIDKLKKEVPNLIVHTVKKKKFLSFKEKLDKELDKLMSPETLISLIENVAQQIRMKMLDFESEFKGEFNADALEENTVPMELLILVNSLLHGNTCNLNKGFSLPVKTISELILFNHKKVSSRNSTVTRQRHATEKETPFVQYFGLKLYSTVRSRGIVDVLFEHGICISYDRILRITQGLGEASLQLFEDEDAVVPGILKSGVFTVGAKDNIDKNSTCTISKSHYHGTSISLFQFPRSKTDGRVREYSRYVNVSNEKSKKVRELPTFYTDVNEIRDAPKTIYSPVQTINISETDDDVFNNARSEELQWVDYVCSLSTFKPDTSWSVYHARKSSATIQEPIINSVLPLLSQSVATLSMQKHCIEVIRSAVDLLNPGQVTVDVSDQPVYALSKQIQILYPDQFGPGLYFPMFGGLHIEKVLLVIHGQLIQGSGLSELMDVSNLSVSGSGDALVKVPHITRTRYLVQVCLCAEFKALKDAHSNRHETSSVYGWLTDESSKNDMIHYWKMIIDFQLHILLFIRSQREKNFLLYINVLKRLMKYIFAFNHHHYARWLTVHVDDLLRLQHTAPSLYDQFLSGNFVLQKSNNPFSAIALDQGHEQNNAMIKGSGGAIGILSSDSESALRRWEVAGPDVGRLLEEYESVYLTNRANKEKHHEDYNSFQEIFFKDVSKLYNSFINICNPFEEETLIALHNGKLMASDIKHCLSELLDNGDKSYRSFCYNRLERCEVPLTQPINNNVLMLPSSLDTDETKKTRLHQAKDELKFGKSVQVSLQYREELSKECFKYEVTDFPSSLTKGQKMYHSNKADLFIRFKAIPGAELEAKIYENCAMIVDFSVIVNIVSNRKRLSRMTFKSFCLGSLYNELMKVAKYCFRMDIVTDSYPEEANIKRLIQEDRGSGKRLIFDDETSLPTNFSTDFLRNNDNKREFYPYAVNKIIEKGMSDNKCIVVTSNEKILTNNKASSMGIQMPDCSHIEADTRIILHVMSCVGFGITNIIIRSVDTDVFVLLIAYMPVILQKNSNVKIIAQCGVGKYIQDFSINAISQHIGLDKCEEILFLHSFTGCDYTSSFYKVGKCKWWDAWVSNRRVSQTFKLLSSMPQLPLQEKTLHEIEKFVIHVYDSSVEVESIDVFRYEMFKHKGDLEVRTLPPTKDALRLHIHRAAFVSGWLWGISHIPTITIEPPQRWGWNLIENRYIPQWIINNSLAIFKKTFKKCGCRRICSNSCSCKKNNLQCLPICKCRRKCSL